MPAMPNTSILAILTVRNEGAFLIDWLAHHRAAGVTDFLVFSNDCQDGTDRMLDRLQALGRLTHVRNDAPAPEGPQWAALKAADRHPLKGAADWVMVLDIDEFVTIHAGDHTLAALLAALPQATAIPLTWRLFGNAGIVRYEDRPVWDIFTRAAPAALPWPWRASLFKTLFRNDGSYHRLGVHRPRDPDPDRLGQQRWVDGSGRDLPELYREGRIFTPPGQDCQRLAQINHYALGAMESYVLKCDRGRANRAASAFDLAYWVERNLCAVEDRSLAGGLGQSAAIRAGLRADPVLADLHDNAVRWRRERFLRLMEEEPYRALFGRLLMTPPSRILTPEESRFLMTFAAREQSAKAARIDPPTETG
jgi:Glycosyl transferase family 2